MTRALALLGQILTPLLGFTFCLFLSSCSSTEITESPRTGFVSDTAEAKTPAVVWTSRTLTPGFEYLGQIKVRSWTYDGALARLIEGGRQVKADAIIDVQFEDIGFLTQMHAFAIKYK